MASPGRDRGKAAFFEAIRSGDRKAVEAALAADAGLPAERAGLPAERAGLPAERAGLLAERDEKGRSAVMAAAYAGHSRLAEMLAERAGPGGLSLFEAAATDQAEAVAARLEAGSEIEDHSADGYAALHFAAYFGRLEVARMLLERGADPNSVAQNASRVTPLHSAVAGRHRDLAGLLLAHGASANAVQQGGWTPLHAAAQNGDEATMGLLLLRDADASRPADDGRTPADLAAQAGYAALAEMLREAEGR